VNLPNASAARVERAKIVGYLLATDHPEGASKAEFFGRFGFDGDNWEILGEALILHAGAHPVVSIYETKYGAKYRIHGPLSCPDGRSPMIRSVWIIDADTAIPRLVTAHPV